MITTILVVVLVLMLLGALPAWPYSHDWGYAPGALIGLLLIILVVMMLAGHSPFGPY
jgi:hypothetical protein